MYYLIDTETYSYLREEITNWTYFWSDKDIKKLYVKKEKLANRRFQLAQEKEEAKAIRRDKRTPYRSPHTSGSKHASSARNITERKYQSNDSYKMSDDTPYGWPGVTITSDSNTDNSSSLVNNHASHSSPSHHVEFGGGTGGHGGASGSWNTPSDNSYSHSSYSHSDSSSHSSYDSGHSSYDSGSSSYDSGSSYDSSSCDSGSSGGFD